jgi:hypothetical protein
MTRHIRIKGKHRRPVAEDKLALAFLLFAKQQLEEQRDDQGKQSDDQGTEKRRD